MTLLRTLRTLVLGETWILPLGIGIIVGSSAILRSLLDQAWRDLGGFALLTGTLSVLVLSIALSARQRP